MKTPSILTLACSVLLLGIGGVGIRTSQAFQDAPAADENPAAEKGSDEAPEKPSVAENTPEEGQQADALLSEARSRLADRQSLQADMKQQIVVGERKLLSEGTYVSGVFPKLRLEYKIRVGTMQGSLTEVCDGQILHTEKTIGKVGAKSPKELEHVFTRRDVQRILAARNHSSNLSVASQGADLGIGGLPAMLASIDRCMNGKRMSEEEFEGQMCRVFHGVWDQAILQKYDAALKEAKASLVPFFPDLVQVFLTADTLTPVKIVYLKQELNESGKITGDRALMILEFRNLKLDEPVPASTFQFVLPSGREETDLTKQFLDLIKEADAVITGETVPPAKKK